MKFVTAAYGERYHRWANGLVRSFAECNDAPLTVYTDAPEGTFPNQRNAFAVGEVQIFAKQFHSGNLRWVKLLAMRDDILHDDVCWIDCDVLVLTDLTRILDPGVINAATYGRGGRMRDCGCGLRVPQSRYYPSYLFSLPDAQHLMDFCELGIENRQHPPCRMDGSLSDQPVLNRLIHKHGCHDINTSGYHFGFAPWHGHVRFVTRNTAMRNLVCRDSEWSTGNHKIGAIPFLSSTLQAFIDGGFSNVADRETRDKLAVYYD